MKNIGYLYYNKILMMAVSCLQNMQPFGLL